MRKIHCIDLKENSTFDEIREFVGWIEPPDKENETWDVTMVEGYFACKTQETAQILASIEEVKALLIKQTGGKMENEQTETPQETTEETSETPEETTETTEEESENEEKSSEEDSETKEE